MKPFSYHFIAQRLLNSQLALCPDKLEPIMLALGPRLGITGLKMDDGEVIQLADAAPSAFGVPDCNDNSNIFETIQPHGIAYIPIHGELVQRGAWVGASSGLVSYEWIAEAYEAALADPAVKAVFLDIDSPGGEVSGLFDMVDMMLSVKRDKPVHAHANELAASAAYAVAAAADHLSTPRTGAVGSIGVICIHTEMSRRLKKEGITVTVLRAGIRKAEINPVEPLADDPRDFILGELEKTRAIFVKTVARGRNISEKIVRNTEAAVFGADEALALGLVDAIMSTQQAAAHLLSRIQ